MDHGEADAGDEAAAADEHQGEASSPPHPPAALEDSDADVVIHCHSTVLCANSSYFRSKLLGSAVRVGGSGSGSGGMREVRVEIDPRDLPAARSVMRFMYTEARRRLPRDAHFRESNCHSVDDSVIRYSLSQVLENVASPSQLISILRVAGRLKAR